MSPWGPAASLWFCCAGPVDIHIVAKCNACLSGPCKNNGTCSQDPVELYRCACPYGYKVRQEAHHLRPSEGLVCSWGCPVYCAHARLQSLDSDREGEV